MLWIGLFLLPRNGSRKVPTTTLSSFVNQSNAHRRFIWNKATKAKRTVERHHKFTVGGFEITVSVDIDVARTSTTASS
jgi:phage-related protein